MEIEYRAFEKSRDYPSQRSLFRMSFPETLGTPTGSDAHYEWKFEGYPATGHSRQYVAAEPEGLVGYYAAIPYPYSVDGAPVTCAMVCDVMTHPDRRGKGIFTRIGRFATSRLADEGMGFASGFPIRPEVIPGHLKVGWKQVQQLPVYMRVLGAGSLLPPRLRFLSGTARAIASLLQSWSLLPVAGYSTDVERRHDFFHRHPHGEDGELPAFIGRWASHRPNVLRKSRDFLKWRTGAPGADYVFVSLRHHGKLVGLAVARPTNMKGVEALAILDCMILRGHEHGCRAIHQELRRIACRLGKDVVACMCSARSARELRFFGSAYMRTPYAFTLIIKKLDERISDEKLYVADRWNVFWLDSDDL